eukprot:Cvel_18291.t1-p1 / transcript=Cvel_18291.t1 / gene=Cvel_18291 / organism=Chromera_velia_CCMP2878 / gene_product=hypothetical protein / transcript_product=hypothetical protein / location=Cvel_scaffold1508:5921-7425(+) / protein_length=324 / sequence_SO=supercontig / SO=protein_coding / is_pseudo=false
MLVARKSFKKSLPVSGMEQTANRKWRFTELGARQVTKAEMLRYFTLKDGKIVPPSVEAEIDLLPQVRGCEGEESPALEGDDDVMEELFGDKRLDEEENQMLLDIGMGAPVCEVFLVNASPIEVPDDFKRGSTQIPATQEEVARGDFNIAIRDEWLRNITEDRNRQRAGVIIPKWIPKAPDLNPYGNPNISDTDYEEIKAAAGAIRLRQIRMVTWVDNLLGAASRQTVSDEIRFLKGVLDWGYLKVHDERDRIKYVGLDISFATDQTEVSQESYCEGINTDALWRALGENLKRREVRAEDVKPAGEEEVEKSLIPLMRLIMGVSQ